MQTDFQSKCIILADLWANYKDEKEMEDFMEFHDLGLPLAYMVAEGLAEPTEGGEGFILETFDNLMVAFDIEDKGFTNLSELLEEAQWEM